MLRTLSQVGNKRMRQGYKLRLSGVLARMRNRIAKGLASKVSSATPLGDRIANSINGRK